LDEATSHLDEENERSINAAIRMLTIARVIVAHRRSTIDMADRIVPIWPGVATRQQTSHPGTIQTRQGDRNTTVPMLK
jgi:ABC-type bacteriocin/lantibiotic exporter with double-glycine peptidase domain